MRSAHITAVVVFAALLSVVAVHSLPTENNNNAAPALSTEASSQLKAAPRFLIGVVSSPAHVNGRNAIRNTWAKDARARGIDVKFFIGGIPSKASISDQDIAAEGNDVVRLTGFTESYHNLTAKAIGILEHGYVNGYQGVFKADDDTYIRIPKLVEFLEMYPDIEHLYAGHIFKSNRVGKKPNTRWYAYDQFQEDNYPPYTNGPGMFLGRAGLKFIAENKNTLNRIRVDDAAIGVWMREAGCMKMAQMDTSSFEYTPSKNSIWVGPMSAVEMSRIHNGESFAPEVCNDEEHACLCHGHPKFTPQQTGQCWEKFASTEYKDYIPRSSAM